MKDSIRFAALALLAMMLVVAGTLAFKVGSPNPHKPQHELVSSATPKVHETPLKTVQITERKETDASNEAPVFVKANDADIFQAHYKTYAASLSLENGLTYQPLQLTQSHTTQPALRVQLERVACGSSTIYSRSVQIKTDVVSDLKGVCFKHAGLFEERYTPRGDGIEQSFTFEKLPETSGEAGDLQFECALSANGLSAQAARPQRNGGVSFVDDAGRFGARYGQVTVHDSAHHGINIEPKLNGAGTNVVFSVPAAWLREATFPIVVDPLVGGDFQVSPDNTVGVGGPAVVAGTNNSLAIWDDYTNGAQSPRLVASVITQSGVVSAPFQLSNASVAPRPYLNQRTEAAFDGTNWLVVWSEDETSGAAIHGAIVASGAGAQPAGSILGGTDFLIATSTGTVEEEPLAAYDGTDFMVAWMSGPTGGTSSNGSQIFYTRVSSAGAVSPIGTVTAQSTPPSQTLLFLCPQTGIGDVLLVYRENNANPAATSATRIGTDGTLRDPGGITLFVESQSSNGFGRPIGVAFVNSQWSILSSYGETQDSAVFQTTLTPAGAVTAPNGIFTVVGLGPIGTASIDQFAPVFSGPSGWLFLRNERVNNTVYHILGKRVSFAGVDQDPIPFQLDTATQGILRNAVAAQSGNFFLCAWLDGRRGATQPADAQNIFATIVDTTVADALGAPLIPFIAASPVSGTAPLTVSFDSSGSTGSFDTLLWSFGDGTTSTTPNVSHTYNRNGTFIATLALAKGAYEVFRSVVITVGGGTGNTGPGGGTIVGVPIQNSGDLVSSLLISTAVVNLDFTSQRNDSVTITGTVDANAIPTTITGTTGSVTIGSVTFPFTLDAKGNFKSIGSAPTIVFSVSAKSGVFTFQGGKADLQDTLATFGATNSTISPATFVSVPITMTISSFSATVTVGLSYKSTQNQSGKGNYSFLGNGKTVTGTFLVNKFSAKESGNGQNHQYEIHGQLVRPNGGRYKPSASGQFVLTIGTYTVSVPAGQFIADKSGNLKFKSRTGTVGLKKFAIAPRSGIFAFTMDKVPATGSSGSGLPTTGTNVVNVNLALSFQFDLADEQLSAGRYIFILRKNADTKNWKLQ